MFEHHWVVPASFFDSAESRDADDRLLVLKREEEQRFLESVEWELAAGGARVRIGGDSTAECDLEVVRDPDPQVDVPGPTRPSPGA